ncbi:protein commissureless 2 isoform X2 [Hermetia illucens]|uniref:protein commissureless 2 isoform X2 n=1 Tax=Hermetia illucens TaxID=343691 RepID=UPI0018CBF9DA|nr:protein commissureless 2 isoform X2 [Hermetia illucens]XP_037907746.1 protein commissureless 2 isoform X2 [Hermetia illucens]
MDSLEVLKNEVLSSSSVASTIETTSTSAPVEGLAHNYTVLLSKLEKLAALSEINNDHLNQALPTAATGHHGMSQNEYTRAISDIWVGVVLTLLILSTIFFICSCFLYHKFQKWKHSYQTHSPELPEITRRQMDMDLESLPSYTICSGLPTYDDALDQFRKYGIILQPPSVIKIFEDNKEKDKSKTDASAPTGNGENDDNISMTSTCTCGANNGGVANIASISNQNLALVPNVIELNPEQLQMLSNKRLSMQIALNNGIGLNNSIRRSNRGSRVNLFREVSRNNLLRTHEIPSIHRSASQQSLYQDQLLAQRFRNAQHRGSLC